MTLILVRRLTALLLVLVLPTASAARAYGVQHCPHHDGVHGPAGPAEDHQSHAEQDSVPTVSGEAAGGGTAADHDACTCVGPCQACGSAAVALPAAANATLLADSIGHPPVGFTVPGETLPTPAHTHPFATAPPSVC